MDTKESFINFGNSIVAGILSGLIVAYVIKDLPIWKIIFLTLVMIALSMIYFYFTTRITK
ncbi:hypothetical protein HYT53_00885 [Candidatus Woesearchaeota archaeon]|nr:hypothetical protein [Candidatus Woesearchaeota archaeon]